MFALSKFLRHILWDDEIFGRHALSSRGWGSSDKTGASLANDPVEVRLLLLQQPYFVFVLVYCGVMKSWQTCPLVSGVGITG